MTEAMEEYIITDYRDIIKAYKSFKQAMKDFEFFKQIYGDVKIYKLVVDEKGNLVT